MEAEQITNDNIEEMRELYCSFASVAASDFLFELPPISFPDIKANFEENFVKAYICKSTEPEGFLLYSDVLTQGLEITLIYTKNQDNALDVQTTLIKKFVEDAREKYKDKIISYPMLGIQNNFTQDITNLGFTPVGEAILEFNFHNTVSQVVLAKSKTVNLPENYSIDCWHNSYSDEAAKIIYEEFSKLNDAKFDPRFETLEGSKDVLECITKGYYGEFLPHATTVLKYEQSPVGFCFTNLTSSEIANIPLLVISQEHKKKGLGAVVLKNSVNILNNAVINNNYAINVINTTCDTANFPAINTYRKIGFKEKTYYTHAFMKI
ncbi:MAG: GNAT family N-acetyltransferase [bacterium]|nr:GNAT family N-acetyltransferase [bacterium]